VQKDYKMKIIATLLFLLPTVAFAEIRTYSCNYNSYSDQEGNHKVKNKFELNFIVDKAAGKSYLMGNNGSSEVKMLESSDQITFLEVTVTGNIMTTAIDSKLNTVHSRNSVIFGEIFPSQYYGKCELLGSAFLKQ
jgi:hypothetical protein